MTDTSNVVITTFIAVIAFALILGASYKSKHREPKFHLLHEGSIVRFHFVNGKDMKVKIVKISTYPVKTTKEGKEEIIHPTIVYEVMEV